MSYAWVFNLDAELELSRPSYHPRRRVLAQLEHYGTGSRALLGPGDVEAGENARSAGHLGRTWCPTPRALARLSALCIEPEPHPPHAVLRQVNHRRFAHELGGGLPGQRYVERRDALDELLSLPGPWLLKRPLAVVGRGQLRVIRALDDKEQAWIDRSLSHDGLIVEPLVSPTIELSLHGFVWPSGAFEIGRPCVQEVNHRGVFKSVRLMQGELAGAEREALEAAGRHVGAALAAASYFGPFGIDAYRYERAGQTGFCALSEINARYTMGFATGFPRPAHELRLEVP